MVRSALDDVVVATTSALPQERRKALEARGVRILIFDGRNGRVDIPSAVAWLGEQNILSVIVEAGSKVNWAVLESQCADKIYFYYAPKILGGTQSLSMAGGVGRRRRSDAIRVRDLELHTHLPRRIRRRGVDRERLVEKCSRESLKKSATCRYQPRESGARLTVNAAPCLADAIEGCSIAVNGVCLTALAITPDRFQPTSRPKH